MSGTLPEEEEWVDHPDCRVIGLDMSPHELAAEVGTGGTVSFEYPMKNLTVQKRL